MGGRGDERRRFGSGKYAGGFLPDGNLVSCLLLRFRAEFAKELLPGSVNLDSDYFLLRKKLAVGIGVRG